MAFRNSILAGDTIVRRAMQSEGFQTGVAGWRLERDGDAEFNDVTVRGELESSNYVPGVSGWQLDDAGTAEFNSATVRGTMRVDGPDDSYLQLVNFDDGQGLIRPAMYFFFDDGVEPTSEAYIWHDRVAASDRTRLHLFAGDDVGTYSDSATDDHAGLWLVSRGSGDGPYIRANKEVRATDPLTAGLPAPWRGLSTLINLDTHGTQVVQYRKCPNGDVEFRGRQVNNRGANVAAHTVITTVAVPAEYRPSSGYSATVTCGSPGKTGAGAPGNPIPIMVEMQASGHIAIRTTWTNEYILDFTGLRYSTTGF